MSSSWLVMAALLVAIALQLATAQDTNCDPGTDIARNDVNLTDVAFKVHTVDYNYTTDIFEMDQRYYPEQVIPYQYRSSVFMYFTYVNGTGFVTDGDCGFEWDFGSGNQGIHGSDFQVPAKCMTMTNVSSTVTEYEGNIEYYYCIGNTTSCDRVEGSLIGYDATDRNSLDPEHYCTKIVYDIKITVTEGPLDTTVSFVLEYIRDPIDTSDIDQFFDADGNARVLDEEIIWAVCDYNELGDVGYEECFARMAPNPEPRVLDLSTSTETNPFSVTFGLQGSDVSLVDDAHPLTVDAVDSQLFLFHALHSGSYDTCGAYCTDATNTTIWNVLEFNVDVDVKENYHVAVEGNMPVFDPASTMQCDLSFCTMVLVINFEAKSTRRRLELPFRFGGDGEVAELDNESGYRLLEQSATQDKSTKVTVPRSFDGNNNGGGDLNIPDNSNNNDNNNNNNNNNDNDSGDNGNNDNNGAGSPNILVVVVAVAVVAALIVGAVVVRQRNQNDNHQNDNHQNDNHQNDSHGFDFPDARKDPYPATPEAKELSRV